MSSTQHTPGPWLIEIYPTKYPDLKTYTVIAPHGWQEPTTGEYSTCSVVQSLDNEADARLIATAPDLLAALETALDVMGDWGEDGDPAWAEWAREVIAKAKGE